MAAGDIKLGTAASSALTITLASLAASSTWAVGRESASVDNTTNLYLDYLLSGKVTTGTGPTAGVIEVWVAGIMEDTPTWPDVFAGADAGRTITAPVADVKAAALKLAFIVNTDTTANRTYWFAPVSVASLFGGVCPLKFSIFVTHSTVAVIHATGTNHAFWIKPIFQTVAP